MPLVMFCKKEYLHLVVHFVVRVFCIHLHVYVGLFVSQLRMAVIKARRREMKKQDMKRKAEEAHKREIEGSVDSRRREKMVMISTISLSSSIRPRYCFHIGTIVI